MTTTSGFPSRTVADAKSHLADIMRDAIYASTPQIIVRGRSGKERVVVVNPEQFAEALAGYRFDPEVVFSDGEVVVRVEQLGILAAGATFEEAVEDAVRQIREYAQEYFRDWPLYSRTDRRSHLPLLMRFCVTPEDQQSLLLVEPPLTVKAPSVEHALATAV
jgi:hypothetical protein